MIKNGLKYLFMYPNILPFKLNIFKKLLILNTLKLNFFYVYVFMLLLHFTNKMHTYYSIFFFYLKTDSKT